MEPRQRFRVHRSNITACSRCRSKKLRCDQAVPACSNCLKSDTQCIGYDSLLGRQVPRSYLHSLEERVAFLELKLQEHGIYDYDSEPKIAQTPGIPQGHERPDHASGVSNQPSTQSSYVDALLSPRRLVTTEPSSVPPFVGPGSCLPLVNLLLGEVQQNSAVGIDLFQKVTETPTELALNLPSSEMPEVNLPNKETIDSLVHIYFEQVHYTFPCLHRPTLLRQLENLCEAVAANPNTPFTELSCSKIDSYTCLMLFGIGCLLLNKMEPAVSPHASEMFVTTALRLMDDPLFPANLDRLQCIVLLTQYTMLHPSMSGSWYLSSIAIRMATDLGLHCENPILEPLTLDRGRRLFWAAYSMDRTLCIVLGRPFSISEQAISAEPPFEFDDEDIAGNQILSNKSAPNKVALVHLLKHARFLSEVAEILYQPRPSWVSGNFSYEAWRNRMDVRLRQWYNTRPEQISTAIAPKEVFEGAFHNALIYLYRPSQYLPLNSDADLHILAMSSFESINIYSRSFREGKLRFYWRALHNLFIAGLMLLYSVVWSIDVRHTNIGHRKLISGVSTCSAILWGLAERCPSGKWKRDVFDALSSAILDRLEMASQQAGTALSGTLNAATISNLPSSLHVHGLDTSSVLTPSIFDQFDNTQLEAQFRDNFDFSNPTIMNNLFSSSDEWIRLADQNNIDICI